jgi:hypothetical protein
LKDAQTWKKGMKSCLLNQVKLHFKDQNIGVAIDLFRILLSFGKGVKVAYTTGFVIGQKMEGNG